MTPDGRAETSSWEIWFKIHFNNCLIESCVRLYIIYIYINVTQRWSSLDVTNILSLLDRMCQTFKIDLFIVTQALGYHVKLQESFKLWQRRCLNHFIYTLFWVLWSS